MIENPKVGDPVVYFLGNGTLDQGLIADVENLADGPLSVVEVKAAWHVRHRLLGSLYRPDDHDGIIAGMNNLIENCQTTIELTNRKKLTGRPVFDPPAPALYKK